MQDAELRRSLETVGPLLPELYYAGASIDGRRRAVICSQLGLVLPVRYAESLQVACSSLFPLHPSRAIELAGTQSVRDLADLCSVGAAAIASELARTRPTSKPDHRAPRERKEMRVKVQIWVDPQWKHYVTRAGELERLDLSTAIRRAGWDFVQRTLPNPPTEGTRRGTSVDLGTTKRPR